MVVSSSLRLSISLSSPSSPAGRTTTFQRRKAYAVPGGVRTRTLTDILRKPIGDIDNLSSDPFRCVKFEFKLNFFFRIQICEQ